MRNTEKLIIHIGLPKTGTTFLQLGFFPFIESYHFVRGKSPTRKLYSNDKRIVISDEAIVGSPLEKDWLNNFEAKIVRLKKIFKDPVTIIGFRKHEDWIFSLYKQYLHQGGIKTFDEFISFYINEFMNPGSLPFFSIIKVLEKHLGSEFFIYTQEELKDNFDIFLKRLESFFNIKIDDELINNANFNKGITTNLQFYSLIRLNRLNQKIYSINPNLSLNSKIFRKFKMTPRLICQKYLKLIPSKKYVMPNKTKSFIRKVFSEDWRMINELINTQN